MPRLSSLRPSLIGRRLALLGATCALLSLCLPAQAQQFNRRVLISPITGKPFDVTVIPVTSGSRRVIGDAAPADMGTDTDGCRHNSGVSEYDYYVVTDPYSYFTALSVEYPDIKGVNNGRLRSRLSKEFRDWVVSKDGLHSEWVLDKDKFYDRAQRIAKHKKQVMPPIKEWVIPQGMIPIEKRYRMALNCYKKRGATDAFLGKLALTASWATRVRMNKPLVDSRLKGGIEEVNSRLVRYIKDGDSFKVENFYDAYSKLFAAGGLTEEAYFVAGMTLNGFALRMGYLKESIEVLETMTKRFKPVPQKDNQLHEFFRGVIRQRRQTIKIDYVGFLDLVAEHFIRAIQNEEFSRANIAKPMLIVAESLRRLGHYKRAAGWYLALGQMDETQPALREEIRANKKMPNVDAPFPVLLAWQADTQLEALRKELARAGVKEDDLTSHTDSRLLNAIVTLGLGTREYRNPLWRAQKGESAAAVHAVLREVGLAILDYVQKARSWPDDLHQIWERGIISNKNRVNRFRDPQTGEPLLYKKIGGDITTLPKGTVLLATQKPIKHGDDKEGYALFLSNLEVVFSKTLIQPGQIFKLEK